MAFPLPTQSEVVERSQADVARELGISRLRRRTVVNALAVANGKVAHAGYRALEWVFRQVFAATADSDSLERRASIWLNPSRLPPARAAGTATFTGTEGAILPQGTRVQRSGGTLYSVDEQGVISGGTVDVVVRAEEGGADGNAEVGTTLTLLSPVTGIDSSATVATGGLVDGRDQETDEELRERLRQRLRNPPQAGSVSDYIRWALEVPAVTRAWVAPLGVNGDEPSKVSVWFVTDGDPSGILPGAAKVQEVADHIEQFRPVGAIVEVAAPTLITLDPQIALTPDTTALRVAVETAIADLLLEEGQGGSTLYWTHLHEVISAAEGEIDHSLLNPITNFEVPIDAVLTLGTTEWL